MYRLTHWTLLLSALLLLQPLAAQPDLRKDFDDYFSALQRKRYAKVLDYLHPALFEMTTREDLLTLFEGMDADSTLTISFDNLAFSQMPLAMSEGELRYAIIPYQYDMLMKLQLPDSAERASMVSLYRSFYSQGEFAYDDSTQTISLHMDTRAYGFLKPRWTTWRFLQEDQQSEPLIEELIPRNVLTELEMGIRVESEEDRR